MESCEPQIAQNLAEVRRRVEEACARCGRAASAVKLVAVTKYAQLEWVRALVQLGVCELGESRPQQLVERAELISGPVKGVGSLFPLANHDAQTSADGKRLPTPSRITGDAVHWHLIGHLQRNKARRVLPLVSCIHSVDTLKLLAAIDRLADELHLRPRVLIEVTVSGEAAKNGFALDELVSEWSAVCAFHNVDVEGLMTMAPLAADPEEARPVFRGLRELRDRLLDESPSEITLPELSMGMSRDFEVAVEEGATIIRIGSELYTGLPRDD